MSGQKKIPRQKSGGSRMPHIRTKRDIWEQAADLSGMVQQQPWAVPTTLRANLDAAKGSTFKILPCYDLSMLESIVK